MPDKVRTVDYYYITTPDKPGEGARVLAMLKSARVDLLAFHAFPEGGRAQLDFVPKNTAAFLRAARRAKLKLSEKKKAFLVQGPDRVGATLATLEKLSAAGINVTAGSALSAGGRRFGAIIWVNPKDFRRALKALGL
ncbi:MAG: hypothetical protein ACE5JJ_09640 [Nitrospinota bacterium]